MIGLRRMLAITSALPLVVFLLPASSASAATSLYYGSIRIIFPYGASSTYSIPFGANISYPHMNNLPAGNIATVSGSAPAAIGLGANQITLHTSLFTTSPPPSWYASEVLSTFSGGHAAGNFYENGGPGAASSAPLSSIPASQFGVTFKGTPGRFGGTLALLGNHRTRWGKVLSGDSSRHCQGFSIGSSITCSIWNLPLSPIGGAFGGSAFGRGWIQPSAATRNFFDQTIWGFPWTTGTVTARAPFWSGGTTSLVYKGTDQRTPAGAGNIQLVTPLVIRLTVDLHDSPPESWYGAGVAIVDLQFVPEPSALLMLTSGMLALAGLFRYSKRAGSTENRRSKEPLAAVIHEVSPDAWAHVRVLPPAARGGPC